MNSVGAWVSLPVSYVSSVTGYPKLSNPELQHCYPAKSVVHHSGFSCTGPLGQQLEVYPSPGFTYLVVSRVWSLGAVGWRSLSVPSHLGPQGSSHR